MVPAFHIELNTEHRTFVSTSEHSNPFAGEPRRAFSPVHPTSAIPSPESVTADLSIITEALERLDTATRRLKKQRELLLNHKEILTTYRLPSPIRRLPFELLSYIFGFSCNSVTSGHWKTPIAISHTCFVWQNIALSLPHLWSYIYVGPENTVGIGNLQELYIKRAVTLPISLRLHQRFRHTEWEDFDIDSPYHHGAWRDGREDREILFGQLFSLSSRIKRLELQIPSEDLELIAELPSEGKLFSALESLTLAIDRREEREMHNPTFPDIFMSSCPLKCVTIYDQNGETFSLFHDKLPWHEIRHVTTHVTDISTWRHLNDDEDSRSRTFHWNCHMNHIDRMEVNVSTPNITSFILCSGMWSPDLVNFMRDCSMPALRDLTVIDNGTPDSDEWSADPWYNLFQSLSVFVGSSRLGLRSLKVVFMARNKKLKSISLSRSLLDMLICVPTLETLQVVEPEDGPHILTADFFEDVIRDGLVPNLQSAELVWSSPHALQFPEDSLLKFLVSRADSCSSLNRIVLGVRKGGVVPKLIREYMDHLRRRGLHTMFL